MNSPEDFNSLLTDVTERLFGPLPDPTGVPAEVTRAGSIMNVHLDGPSAPGQLADLHLALLLNGVYTTPRGMINLSTALSPADLDDVAAAYETAFTMVRSS